MKKQALTIVEIEPLAPAASAEFNERPSFSEDSGAYLSRPETGGGGILRWFVDGLAFAGGAMAGIYVGAWLDPPNSDPNWEGAESRE